jgi:hypothetical protein
LLEIKEPEAVDSGAVEPIEEAAPAHMPEPAVEPEAIAAVDVVVEQETEAAEVAVGEQVPEPAAAVLEQVEAEQTEDAIVEPRPAIQTRKARTPRYEYVADENLEALQKKKPSRRRRRRRLVLDEESGQLISRRKHKRGDSTDDLSWEEDEL